MSRLHDCTACQDTGWVSVSDPEGQARPWSAVCLCTKGERLAAPRNVNGRTVRYTRATKAQWQSALSR